jgi:hypothetical protein
MKKLFNVATATSLLLATGNAFCEQQKNPRINVIKKPESILIEIDNPKELTGLSDRIFKIIDIKNSQYLEINQNINIDENFKKYTESNISRFSFLTKWTNHRIKQLIYEVFYDKTLEVVKNGLFKNNTDSITLDLTNPHKDADVSQFIQWYSTLLDLLDALGLTGLLKDIPYSGIETSMNDLPFVIATSWTLGLSLGALMIKTRYQKPHNQPFDFAIFQSAAAGGILGFFSGIYTNIGRRKPFTKKITDIIKRTFYGSAIGGAIGATVDVSRIKATTA